VSEPETNPYASPRVSDVVTKATHPTPPPRSLLREIVVTAVSMVAGAFTGLMVGGDGLGFVSFVVLCSLMGWVVWIRRKKSFLGTIGICILMVVVWWPFGLMVRELGRGLY